MTDYPLPGRLGDAKMELKSDPRANKNLLKVASAMGFDGFSPDAPFTVSDSMDKITGMIKASEDGFQMLGEAMPNELPGDKDDPKIEHTVETIKGQDSNDVKLHIYREEGTAGQVKPCVVYIHGGGMTILSTTNKIHSRWCHSLAVQGVVSIAIDFRNAYTAAGHNPFPAGLNDCVAGVKWIAAHKKELGISNIVIQGESGGGNLSCATALRAAKEGWANEISGVFAGVPYVSGGYGWSKERRMKELPSTIENDGYFLNCTGMALMAHYYTPEEKDKTNPLAWPYHATEADLKGLPPHILSMDELDPLRDEGIAYYRKLEKAGVPVTANVNLGVTHASSLMFRQALPELHNNTIRSITSFAKSM